MYMCCYFLVMVAIIIWQTSRTQFSNKDPFGQAWFKMAQWFQIRYQKYESLRTNDRHQVMVITHMTPWFRRSNKFRGLNKKNGIHFILSYACSYTHIDRHIIFLSFFKYSSRIKASCVKYTMNSNFNKLTKYICANWNRKPEAQWDILIVCMVNYYRFIFLIQPS